MLSKKYSIVLVLFFCLSIAKAQLKYIVNDFEGLSTTDFKPNESGLFVFGSASMQADISSVNGDSYSGTACFSVMQRSEPDYSGWGQGINAHVELDPLVDQFNFFVRNSLHGSFQKGDSLMIELQDDDDGDSRFDSLRDDRWTGVVGVHENADWQLVSIPLYRLVDSNTGGDGIFNINHQDGKLLCLLFRLPGFAKAGNGFSEAIWKFDFLCFSQSPLQTDESLFSAKHADVDRFCHLGAWSVAGKQDPISSIPSSFEASLGRVDRPVLSVVHFFQPFAMGAGEDEYWMPSKEEINNLITEGYLPMITLEDHFVKRSASLPQPNLYSIVEGHFDDFFMEWAHRISEVHGTVLVRLLHEFNGDWYPWCTANNDQNPDLVIRAFRHIHDIFIKAEANNVRFVWCPNSLSKPDEDWNFILNAYPGDDYVDFVGLDIYNGAGEGLQPWRSFRKEGIPNYFLITQKLPQKPFLVCETASREQTAIASEGGQDKAAWIAQMSDALHTDMAQVRLVSWFNERPCFLVNSSPQALTAFKNKILYDAHFRKGVDLLIPTTNTKR